MLHTIQADFYRLVRSKGFWITEAILVLNILSGVIFGATGHVGVNTESKLPQATEVWTGFKALTNYSASISVTILFTIIVITLVLGTDLTQNLYKNSLAYGVSRTSYYFAKSAVVLTIALFQFLVSYGLVFLLASLYNGIGTMPEHFLAHSVPLHPGLGQHHFLPPLCQPIHHLGLRWLLHWKYLLKPSCALL